MAIPIIDNFKLNSNLPIETRIVASNSTARDAIEYKYDGLKVFDLDTRITWIWNQNKYLITSVTSSSWDDESDGNITGQGTYNYIPKWDSTGVGLTNSSIITSPTSIYEINQKIGIGGSSNESLQVNSNYSLTTIGTVSSPFVIHKGVSTIIGENWFGGISGVPLTSNPVLDSYFYSYLGSSTITFNKGGFVFKGRQPGSSATMNTMMSINSDASVLFNNYLSLTSSTPPSVNGSIYVDSSTNRFKVIENTQSRFISRTYEVYITVLTQSGLSSAPTETLLESTIGTGVWSRLSNGIYNLSISSGFVGTAPQISGLCGPYTSTNVFFGQKINDNTYQIQTLTSIGSGTYSGSLLDSLLNETLIEIKVWKNIVSSTTTTTTTGSVGSTTTTTTTTSPITTSTTTTTTTTSILPYYVNNTGLYPAGSTYASSTGIIINPVGGSTVYIYLYYNTAGDSTGTALATEGISGLAAGGYITSTGQSFISSGYVTMLPNTSISTALSKSDGINSGAYARFAYSYSISGPLHLL